MRKLTASLFAATALAGGALAGSALAATPAHGHGHVIRAEARSTDRSTSTHREHARADRASRDRAHHEAKGDR